MNGRRAKQRRAALRTRNAGLLASIKAAVPVRQRTTDEGMEVWQRGPVTLVVPTVPLDYPEPIQTALTVYRMATLTTDCPRCANQVQITEAGGYLVRHEPQCPGDPDQLVALAAEHGIELNRGL